MASSASRMFRAVRGRILSRNRVRPPSPLSRAAAAQDGQDVDGEVRPLWTQVHQSVELLPAPATVLSLESLRPGCRTFWGSPSSSTESVVSDSATALDAEGPEDNTGLPTVERCKNFLVANWRGQLSTLKATQQSGEESEARGDRDRVLGSLVRCSLHDATPLVWFPPDDPHIVNLVMDERASLLLGGTDPPALVRALHTLSKFPPRAIFVGDLLAVDHSEIAYLRRRMEAAAASTSAALAASGLTLPPTQSLPGHSGTENGLQHPLAPTSSPQSSLLEPPFHSAIPPGAEGAEGRGHAAEADGAEAMLPVLAPPASSALPPLALSIADDWVPFRMHARSCQFVGVGGQRIKVPVPEIRAAAADPLATVSCALLDCINRTDSLRRAIVLFCAAYMGVQLRPEGAYMIGLDRRGFNVLGCTEGAPGAPVWREFRFRFHSDVGSVHGFRRVLQSMEAEVLDANLEGPPPR